MIEAGLLASGKYIPAQIRQPTVQTSPAGYVITDLDGQFLEFDSSYCHLLKRNPVDLQSLTLQQVSHIDDFCINLKLLHKLVQHGGPFAIQKRYVRPT